LKESANHIIDVFLEMLASGQTDRAMAQVEYGMKHYPAEGRFYLCMATLLKDKAEDNKAFTMLWRALITEPGNKLVRDEIRYYILSEQPTSSLSKKNFALHSGERQVADRVEQIRIDHRLRYQLAANWIRKKFGAETRLKTGLDIFSGNGYGSSIIAEKAGAKMFGIDGSHEAVDLAERAYGSHRVLFGQAIHPFEINFTGFDFVVSLESIEHVEQPEKLLTQMARASDGPFILSFPDEAGLPFERFGEKFEHHIKHFQREEMLALLASVGRKRVVAEYGQNVYRIENGEITGLLPEQAMGLCRPTEAPQFRIMIVEPEKDSY
jgi:2-polyprenyl-3-methyl-5-hydroxy-6-metoxy-1,4-benzoquinol methylase